MHRAIISSPTALGMILGRNLCKYISIQPGISEQIDEANLKINLKLSTMFCRVYSGRQANASALSEDSGSLMSCEMRAKKLNCLTRRT